MRLVILLQFVVMAIWPNAVLADEVWITEDLPELEFEVRGKSYLIKRGNDNSEYIAKVYPPKAPRACPPHCLQPMIQYDGVTPVGEVGLVTFIEDYVLTGDGYLVDTRVGNWFKAGTIPGAINLPFNMFADTPTNPFYEPLMTQLGGKKTDDGWDFSDAKYLLLFCNGADCGQSPRAIRNLVDGGYNPEKLMYYRGGMKDWVRYGFSIQMPE